MSGTAEPIRPPKTDAELARDHQRRLESLENPTSQRVGPWVVSTSTDGHLIASHVDGGAVVLARKPARGENDPDSISDQETPQVTVIRTALQTIPAAGARILFDGIRSEVGGDWTGGRAQLDAVAVPVSGVYRVTGNIHWEGGGAILTSVVMVDDVTRIAGRVEENGGGTWITSTAVDEIPLDAGQSVGLLAYANGVRNVGAATLYGSPIPCSLSLSLIARR